MKNKLNIYLSALSLLFPLSIVATTLFNNSNTKSSSIQPPKYEFIKTLSDCNEWSRSLAFNPLNETILATGGAMNMRIWNTQLQRETATLSKYFEMEFVNSLAFLSKQPNLLTSGNSEETSISDIDLEQLEITAINSLAFHPKQPKGTIILWDISNLEQPRIIKTFKGHTGKVTSLAFQSKEPYLLASGSTDNTIKLWDVRLTETNIKNVISSFAREYDLELPVEIEKLIANYAFSPKIILEGHTDSVKSVAFHPEQPNRLVSASKDETIRLWDVNEQKEITTLENNYFGETLAFQHEEPYYLATADSDTIKIWDITTQEVKITLTDPDYDNILDLAFHPIYGNFLAASNANNTIKLLDIYKNRVIDTLSGHTDGINKIVFQFERPYLLVSASWDETIKLWGDKTMAHKNERNNNSNSVQDDDDDQKEIKGGNCCLG